MPFLSPIDISTPLQDKRRARLRGQLEFSKFRNHLWIFTVKGHRNFRHRKEASPKPLRGRIQRFYEEIRKEEDEIADLLTNRLCIRKPDDKVGQTAKKESDLAGLYQLSPDF